MDSISCGVHQPHQHDQRVFAGAVRGLSIDLHRLGGKPVTLDQAIDLVHAAPRRCGRIARLMVVPAHDPPGIAHRTGGHFGGKRFEFGAGRIAVRLLQHAEPGLRQQRPEHP